MPPTVLQAHADSSAVPVWFVHAESYQSVRDQLQPHGRDFAEAVGFEPEPGRHLILPSDNGSVAGVLLGVDAGTNDPFIAGRLPPLLPDGTYRFANGPHDPRLSAIAFALGSYRFAHYRKGKARNVKLLTPAGADHADLVRIVEGVTLGRDLVNTPANDMGPDELEQAARALAQRHGANARTIVGEELLAQNFPLIHAVGRASPRAPRLIDVTAGRADAPKVTLVGKGVCFDTGGLDLKPESAMLIMKKDMGGAASVLAAAHMILSRGLDIRLRVLIPAVENSVSGGAFRPLDVYPTRKGLTVEIGNTDAEGRLVLADALALADEEVPDLLIDMGTLTGAARVALGPDLPPFYTHDDQLARELAECAAAENDPLWRMPLWQPYDALLDSKVADISNVAPGSFAGSVTCALFLNRFVSAAKSWLHIDVYAWNPTTKSGRPEGGECQGARAVYTLLCRRYAG